MNADGDDADVDEETDRNTSYNETPVTSIDHSTSTTASGTTSDPAASQCPATSSTNGQSGTSPAPEMSPSCSAGTPKSPLTKTPPALPPKPKVCSRPAGTGSSPWQPRPPSENASTTAAGQSDDHTALIVRVHTLEKVFLLFSTKAV